jgi:conjugative transfer region protein TrbK
VPRLDAIAGVRIAAVALAVAGIVLAAGHIVHGRTPTVTAATPPQDPLAEALEGCRNVEVGSIEARACEPVWAESRRRFLAVPARDRR